MEQIEEIPFDITCLPEYDVFTRQGDKVCNIYNRNWSRFAFPLEVLIDGKIHYYSLNGKLGAEGNEDDLDLVMREKSSV